MTDLTPQQLANKRQNEKRQGKPRLPGVILTPDQEVLLSEMGELCGSKTAAIFEGLKLLKQTK